MKSCYNESQMCEKKEKWNVLQMTQNYHNQAVK